MSNKELNELRAVINTAVIESTLKNLFSGMHILPSLLFWRLDIGYEEFVARIRRVTHTMEFLRQNSAVLSRVCPEAAPTSLAMVSLTIMLAAFHILGKITVEEEIA